MACVISLIILVHSTLVMPAICGIQIIITQEVGLLIRAFSRELHQQVVIRTLQLQPRCTDYTLVFKLCQFLLYSRKMVKFVAISFINSTASSNQSASTSATIPR